MDKTDNTDNNTNCATGNSVKTSSAGGNGDGDNNSSASGGGDDPIDDGKTPLIEKEHVQAVYDTIAPHW